MPKLTTKASPQYIKMFLLGYSGTGKSWSYVSLGIPEIVPGWKPLQLRILDFDMKAEEVIRSALAALLHKKAISQEQHDSSLENFDVCICAESMGVVDLKEPTGKMAKKFGVVGVPRAWNTAVKQIEKWDKEGWTHDHVLIVDSFTHAVEAIKHERQHLNNRLNQSLTWREYGDPQAEIGKFLAELATIKSNLIVTGHQDPLEIYRDTGRKDADGNPIQELLDSQMLPISIGQSKRVQLPALMNHMLICESEGTGPTTKRYIYTVPMKGVETKTPFYGRCKSKYEIERGMAEYFSLRS